MEDKTFIHAPRRTHALVALALAALAALALMLLVSVPVASAASGGTGLGGSSVGNGNEDGGKGNNSKCSKSNARLGSRTLRLGSCGGDVLSLHWFLKSRKLGPVTGKTFADRTESSVVKFQRNRGLEANGVVNKKTLKHVKKKMKRGVSTFYGSGFYGNKTACGQTLRKNTVGVAVPAEKLKKLPCGTKILFNYKGRWVRAKVIDTGGFGALGRDWDLTEKAAKLLNKDYKSHGVFKVRAAVIKK